MKARNQSSSPVKRPVMICPVSGEVPYFEYDCSFKDGQEYQEWHPEIESDNEEE